MDAFETVVSEILWRRGYWVQNSLKVELTREDKIKIGRHSSPRWEIDVVAYNGARNEILIVECKSYLDSLGVAFKGFDGSDAKAALRYKLFNEPVLRDVIVDRICCQLAEIGLIQSNPTVKLALVCGKIVREKDREQLRDHFDKSGWLFWDEIWLKEELKKMASGSYENSPVAVVAKLLLR